MSRLRLLRAGSPPGTGLPVELHMTSEGDPVILYGHDGMSYEDGQFLKRWADAAAGEKQHHILTDTGPDGDK